MLGCEKWPSRMISSDAERKMFDQHFNQAGRHSCVMTLRLVLDCDKAEFFAFVSRMAESSELPSVHSHSDGSCNLQGRLSRALKMQQTRKFPRDCKLSK